MFFIVYKGRLLCKKEYKICLVLFSNREISKLTDPINHCLEAPLYARETF